MQSVACTTFHSIPERAARWLLHAQDRAGDRIELTQEAFAGLLGVQRTTVNAVVRSSPRRIWSRAAEARFRSSIGKASSGAPANATSGSKSISPP